MNRKKITFGIIGYGAFGELMAAILAKHSTVLVSSRRDIPSYDLPSNVSIRAFEEVAGCDVIVLCNELAALEADCQRLAPLVKRDTVVMDTCSVKLLPAQIMKQYLGARCRVIATHPLFGPQSVEDHNPRGQRVVWHEVAGEAATELEDFMTSTLGLKIIRMSPEEHDKQMAWVHCLTFFVGRALLEMNPPESELATNYYQRLQALIDVEKHHSYELFRTVQLGNIYSGQIRKDFLQTLQTLDSSLEQDKL